MRWAAGYFFVAPALLLIAVFFVFPVFSAFLLSFTDFDIYSLGNIEYLRFVGIDNYINLFGNSRFWTALGNTFYFVAVGGPLSVLVSLGAALLINSKLVRLKTLFRTVYFLPVVTTLVAVAVMWRYLYHPRYGLLNFALSGIGIEPIDWLGDPFLGYAGDHPDGGLEEFWLQHDHLSRRTAEHSRFIV